MDLIIINLQWKPLSQQQQQLQRKQQHLPKTLTPNHLLSATS